MEKAEAPRRSSSEDAHSPSNAEKQVEDAPVAILDIPDPDEGLTEEERKAIVSRIRLESTQTFGRRC